MIKLQTPVADEKCRVGISYGDKIMMLGSCFSDSIGRQLADYGFDVCVNPFGTLYNPVSILRSVERLVSGEPFTFEDCVQIGAGDERWCSFSHHTSFARATREEFLENANRALEAAREHFLKCNKVIVTLGTSWCFRHIENGYIVSNCLKRPAAEFERVRLGVDEVEGALRGITGLCGGSAGMCVERVGASDSEAGLCVRGAAEVDYVRKHIIFTVSPIRHFKDGAHGNQVSKAALLLGIESVREWADGPAGDGLNMEIDYFPSYEIVMDELRDYRFYAEDMCHPTAQTVGYIRDRFLEWGLPPSERPKLEENIRIFKRSSHR